MNHFCTWLHTAPSCPIPALHPARAHVPPLETNVRKTWADHAPVEYGDDYDRVNRDDWFEPGGFRG